MSFDGLVTGAVARQLNSLLAGGKIEKIYQPEPDEVTLQIHKGKERHRLYISTNSSHARLHLTARAEQNPPSPSAFCMLLRKHIQGGRIASIVQKESERVVEILIDTINEMGFSVNKCLTVEIMGKHSNLILLDLADNRIIDSIKRISIDVNRYRQILPGRAYVYPPGQDKTSFYTLELPRLQEIMEGGAASGAKALVNGIQGISPAIAGEMVYLACLSSRKEEGELSAEDLFPILQSMAKALSAGKLQPGVYLDPEKGPVDFHVFPLSNLEGCLEKKSFSGPSEMADYYYSHKASSNRIHQKAQDLCRSVSANLDKLYLKKQRLSEDLLSAENSDIYRLYGELLTANLHGITAGAASVTVLNYYDATDLSIPLDQRFSPASNAQRYFKKYGKAKTAIKEKKKQLEETDQDIAYLESVLSYGADASSYEEMEALREELCELGYLRRRKSGGKPARHKPNPWEYVTGDGFRVLAGRNNKENDHLTFKMAGKQDLWFHAKDIPGSHVILFCKDQSPTQEAILEAAAIAAWHSKAKDSENVPVDYTKVRYVKKPSGAKPGMVIFTDNRTVYTNPMTKKSE